MGCKKVNASNPKKHVDIGSRLNRFLSILLAMDIKANVIDVRPFPINIPKMNTIVDDATELTQFLDDSIESLSAISSLEHFGLGRYGDEIDPEACFKCFRNIQRKLAHKSHFVMTIPIGKERVCFNAHRVFGITTILNSFSELELIEFSYIDNCGLHENVDPMLFDNYQCNDLVDGLFYFYKP